MSSRPVHTLRGHTDNVLAVAADSDGNVLFSAGVDKVIRKHFNMYHISLQRDVHMFGLGYCRFLVGLQCQLRRQLQRV